MIDGDRSQARFDHIIDGIDCPVCDAKKSVPCGLVEHQRFVHAGRMSMYYKRSKELIGADGPISDNP